MATPGVRQCLLSLKYREKFRGTLPAWDLRNLERLAHRLLFAFQSELPPGACRPPGSRRGAAPASHLKTAIPTKKAEDNTLLFIGLDCSPKVSVKTYR